MHSDFSLKTIHYTNASVKLMIVTHLSYSERTAIANVSLLSPLVSVSREDQIYLLPKDF